MQMHMNAWKCIFRPIIHAYMSTCIDTCAWYIEYSLATRNSKLNHHTTSKCGAFSIWPQEQEIRLSRSTESRNNGFLLNRKTCIQSPSSCIQCSTDKGLMASNESAWNSKQIPKSNGQPAVLETNRKAGCLSSITTPKVINSYSGLAQCRQF